MTDPDLTLESESSDAPQKATARESAGGRRPGGFRQRRGLSYGFPVPMRFTETLSPGTPLRVTWPVLFPVLGGANRTVTLQLLLSVGGAVPVVRLMPVQVSVTTLKLAPVRVVMSNPVGGDPTALRKV